MEQSLCKARLPMLSVIIPHLNQAEALEACLASLDCQSLHRTAFEVIVVDNGSRVIPEAVVARHPGTKLVSEPSPGPGKARNRGVSLAAGGVFAFIDADCRAHRGWLQNALQAMETAPPRTIIGGDVQIWRDNQTTFSALEAYESVFAYRFQLYIEKHGFSGTGNLIVRRDDFNLVGPFKGIEVAEDIDWGQRALNVGCAFRYVPEIIVYHPARETLQDLYVKWDRHIQHAINTARSKRAWRLAWFARAVAIFMSPVFDLPKIIGSNRLSGAGPRLKALLVLVSVRAYRAWRMLALSRSHYEVIWNQGTAPASPTGRNRLGPKNTKNPFDRQHKRQ